jgi:hypothetical protein
MDHYHVWFDLKPGVRDVDLADELERYLGHLTARGAIASYGLTRRKLGFGPPHLGENR